MIQSITPSKSRKGPLGLLLVLLLTVLLGSYLYHQMQQAQPYVYATATTANGIAFSYEIIHNEMEVDWNDGGDFDPRDKCPDDFFSEGFIVICKKMRDGGYFKFLYHKGKRMLYRMDKDIIEDNVKIGLHWVENTRFNSKYRIADRAFKGGKTLSVPNAKGSKDLATFQYGEAISKRRIAPRRELFEQTHIKPKSCPEWWDIFNFIP